MEAVVERHRGLPWISNDGECCDACCGPCDTFRATNGLAPGEATEEADADAGTFEARVVSYGTTFDTHDGPVKVRAGAFAKWLRTAPGARVPILWNHDVKSPVGKIVAFSDDADALYCRGRLSNTRLGRDLQQLVCDQAISEVSASPAIGASREVRDPDWGVVREITEASLMSVSLVMWGALRTGTDYVGVVSDARGGRSPRTRARALGTRASPAAHRDGPGGQAEGAHLQRQPGAVLLEDPGDQPATEAADAEAGPHPTDGSTRHPQFREGAMSCHCRECNRERRSLIVMPSYVDLNGDTILPDVDLTSEPNPGDAQPVKDPRGRAITSLQRLLVHVALPPHVRVLVQRTLSVLRP